jgi:menaquinone-dependent protoporphyrinogen oxidase
MSDTNRKETTMSSLVLVGYATRYGSTLEVAEAVEATLRECGLEVDIQPTRKVRTLEGYRGVVLGAPLFMFHWHKDALRFLSRNREALTERPVAVFALGPTHDPYDEGEWRDSRAHLDKELARFPWLAPVALEMFGGKYDPAKLRFPVNLLAGKVPASDLRDWTAIRAWAAGLKSILAA